MSCPGSPPLPNDLDGLDPATLQTWLTEAQNALHKYMLGQKEVEVQVTGGGQHREVRFYVDRNSLATLRSWIMQLQRALGKPNRRSALSVSF